MTQSLRIAALCVCLLSVIRLPLSLAVEPPLAADKLVVDVVTLKSGQQFRGSVMRRDADGTTRLVVQREWLKRQHPSEFERLVSKEPIHARMISQELIDRLKAWLKEQPEPATLSAFLELDLEREERRLRSLNGEGKPLEPTQFVYLPLDGVKIRSVFIQPAETRKWAALAWQSRLDNVERRTREDLQKTLKANGVTAEDPVNIWERLPSLPQMDEEWAARRALIEFQYGPRVEFQGLGDSLIRTGPNAAKLDWAALLPTILQGQIQAQLGDLLGEGVGRGKPAASQGLKKAIDQAEAEHARVFRVTELGLDVGRKRATVTTKLVARLSPDRWETIWQHSVQEDGSKARPEIERRIEADPQVKEALGLLKGLDVGAGDAVTGAVRVGAAVMTAQQAADREFQQFLGWYLKRLDSPPLRRDQ